MTEKEKHYTVTVYIAVPGTPLAKSGGTSAAGHMYYSISDGTRSGSQSFGFAPKEHGDSIGPGKVYGTDVADYKDPRYARTMEISKEQYEKLKEFGRDPEKHGFDMKYNGLINSCVDFTWGGLNQAGLHRRHPFFGIEHKGFDGDVKPLQNIDDIKSIKPPLPNSDLNEERLNRMPKQTWKEVVVTSADPPEDGKSIASRPESVAQNDIRDRLHPGNRIYCDAIKAIECSPNIPPGTFVGKRLEQAAANLANVSIAGEDRQQGGRNEVLGGIDFAVFNKQQNGLIAVQGELGNPMSKLAYLSSAQDNSTTLAMASQQTYDTLQRAQEQSFGHGDQSLDKTQSQGGPSIGPRMV